MKIKLPPIPQGPFLGNIVRSADRTIVKNCLHDAQGIIQVERGRPRACWEGATTENTFAALTDGTANISKAPDRAIYWRAVAKVVAASKFRATYDGGSVNYVESESGDSAKEISFCEHLGYLIVAVKGEPMRFIRADDFADATDYTVVDNLEAIEEFRGLFALGGQPAYFYHKYTECDATSDVTSTFDETEIIAGTNVNAAYTGAVGVGAHGAPQAMSGSASLVYTANLTRNNTHDTSNWEPQNIAGSFWVQPTSATTGLETGTGVAFAANFGEAYRIRIGMPNQQFMGRFPTTYRRRLCVVEGRDYEYTQLNGGLGGAYMRVPAASLTRSDNGSGTQVDLGSIIKKGDELILFVMDNPADHGRVRDYVVAEFGLKRTVTAVRAAGSGGVANSEFPPSSNWPSLTTSANWSWVARRALTTEQLRTVWFAGRAADTANSIGADITDFMKFESASNVIVGSDSDGAITALFTQADDRLIVGMEYGIYQILGDPPLGAAIPANFTVVPDKIASVGVKNNDCIVSDTNGQYVYFATPQGRVMRLVGGTVEDISTSIAADQKWPASFIQLQFIGDRLYCLENADDPYVWIFDTLAKPGAEWAYTWRGNSGQDQTGTLAALPVSNASYGGKTTATGSSVTANNKSITLGSAKTWRKRSIVDITDDSGVVRRYWAAVAGTSSTAMTLDRPYEGATDATVSVTIIPGNRLYPASGDHGGILAPFRGVDGEPDRLLVVFSDGTDYKTRTLNHLPDEHNYANLCHGVRLQTNYETAGRQSPKRVRRVSVLDTKPMLDDSGGSDFNELHIEITGSEGGTILARDITPETSNVDSNDYEFPGTGGRGDTAVSATIGDGISSLPGELADVELTLIAMPGRR